MGLNFRKSINLGKGFKLNIGKKSVGISGGVKGARVSINSSGRKTATFSIPGTGLSYTVNLGKKKSSKKKGSASTTDEDDTPTNININGFTAILLLVIVILLLIIIGAAFAYFTGII